VSAVPSTAAQRHLKQAAYDTKTAIQKTATAAQESIVKLKSAPDQFHCSVCDSLLFVPKGAWMCQACATSNQEDNQACSNEKCSQKKTQQKVLCGICNQAVLVPTSNFMNSLGHTERQMSSGIKKAYYTIADKAHVICPRCKKQVLIPEDKGAAVESKEADAGLITVQCAACSEKITVQRVKPGQAPESGDSGASSASPSASGGPAPPGGSNAATSSTSAKKEPSN
jgi:DNA-directed RNA polymerase subunit RPC12/RpoP